MILLLAIGLGLFAGWVRARLNRRNIRTPHLRQVWIVPLAFLPQLLAFYIPGLRNQFSEAWIPWAIGASQLLLCVFVWKNRFEPGFALLGIGLLMNLTVILLNAGWMPISPERVRQLAPSAPAGAWASGQRLGFTKDRVIPASDIRLEFLSDRFVTPTWLPYHVAFSLGDILVAFGAFWFFWSLGAVQSEIT